MKQPRQEIHQEPSTPDPKEASKTLMGMLILQQAELVKAARHLVKEADGIFVELLSGQIIPDLEERIKGLRGDRPLAPACDSQAEPETAALVSAHTGEGNEFAAECLPPSLTTRLTDFFTDFGRVLVHYNVLHSLALAASDEVLAGIAWNHAKQVKETFEHGMLLVPAATIKDFGNDPNAINQATEQMARIWDRMRPGSTTGSASK